MNTPKKISFTKSEGWESLSTIPMSTPEKISFTKMHGAGNDYVYIDCMQSMPFDPATLAVRVSDRHKGIGSDGLVLILPSEIADFRMRMFNADGTEAQMCGNASRCVGKYVYEHKLTAKTNLTLETLAGIKHLSLILNDGKVEQVSVMMGKAEVQKPKHITADDELLDSFLRTHSMTQVNIGNPHAVYFVDDTEQTDVHGLGAQIEILPCFPEKTNVEFVEIISRNEIRMRVWERGTGETMACGTGACAAVAAAVAADLTDNDVIVHLLGGDLHIAIDIQSGEIMMTGQAEEVFAGVMTM